MFSQIFRHFRGRLRNAQLCAMFEKPVSYHHQHFICTNCLYFQGRTTLTKATSNLCTCLPNHLFFLSFCLYFFQFFNIRTSYLLHSCGVPHLGLSYPFFSDHSHNILHIQALNNMEYQVVFFYSDFHVSYNMKKKKRLLRDVEFKDFLSLLGCFIFWNIDMVLQNRWLKTLLMRYFSIGKTINLVL